MPIPQVPKSCTVITGEQGEAYKRMDGFFQNIIDYIGLDKTRPPEFQFEIKHSFHAREKDEKREQETDDITHYLLYRKKDSGQRVVACVTDIRNDWNYVMFDYFMNLEGIVEGENLPKN